MEKISLKTIFGLGILIRILFLLIGLYMDLYSHVKFTDLDYKVVTDGAKYVLQGKSPYERHTFRYTPFLAYLMIPNVTWNENFGKIFLVLCDILVGIFILKMNKKIALNYQKAGLAIWFFNPITLTLSVRGSSDVIISVLIFGVLILLKKRYFNMAAVLYGFTIHFKIYPIIYCLAIYLYVMKKHKASFFNVHSIKFGFITLFTLLFCTFVFYFIYGYQFLYEGYLYHLTRKDHRHNYSLVFMLIYLTFQHIDKTTSMILMVLPMVLILIISAKFYSNLKVTFFLTSLIFVSYNKVVTAQYFVWYLQFLPILVFQLFGKITKNQLKSNILLYSFWFFVELLWNNFAYRFETLGQDVFIFFHVMNCVFFMMNVMIIFTSIRNYKTYLEVKLSTDKKTN